MKKIAALILACILLTMSFASCTGEGENTTENPADQSTAAPSDQTTAAPSDSTDAVEDTTAGAVELPYASALELLNYIMTTYNATATDDTKLYVGGGNVNNFDTINPDGPAKFIPVADEDYNQGLGYPASEVSKLDDAASMYNLMNTNTFNCYAVHFANSADVDAMIPVLKDNIFARRWICGAPDKLVIVKVPGDYLVVIWGISQFGGIVDPVAASIPANIEGAAIVVDQGIEV